MSERHNHRVVVTERGGPDVMRLIEERLPEPKPGEVRVKVAAAGVVDALGDGVAALDVGQRVAGWALGEQGGYSEYVCWPAGCLVAVPDGVEPDAAVAVVVNYLTAHLYLHETARVRSGERILVHGAAGGLGSALVQLGGLAGLEMYGTASTHNQSVVSSLGARPIDYRTDDFVARVRELTGDGVDVVFDTVGGARQLWRSYRALRKGGRLVPIGSAGIATGGMKVIPLGLLTSVALKLVPDGRRVPLSPNMMTYPKAHPDWYGNALTELLDLTADGSISPIIGERIPLAEAARAHELLAHGRHAGKVVLTIDRDTDGSEDSSWT